MSDYLALFDDIDIALGKRLGRISLNFKLIGYAALALAGLPDRGTKDIDTLGDALKTAALSAEMLTDIENFLKVEFGRGSPGERRHGVYLDIVPRNIPWLPPHPRFIEIKKTDHCDLSRLDPVDVCVSKTFSNFCRKRERARDRRDVLDALDTGLVDFEDYVLRLDKTLPVYETHAEAPETFPRVIGFIEGELFPNYGEGDIKLTYEIPSWMENI